MDHHLKLKSKLHRRPQLTQSCMVELHRFARSLLIFVLIFTFKILEIRKEARDVVAVCTVCFTLRVLYATLPSPRK